MKDLFIIGAGGAGIETAQLVDDINQDRQEFRLAAIVDDAPTPAKADAVAAFGVPLLHGIGALDGRRGQFVVAHGSGTVRKSIADRIGNLGPSPATLIHPTAQMGLSVRLGPGAVLAWGAIVTTHVSTGVFCLHHAYSVVNHNCTLGDFVTLSPFSTMLGGSTSGDQAWLATRSTLTVGTTLGARSVLGAHALALDDIPEDSLATGVPARVKRTTKGMPV